MIVNTSEVPKMPENRGLIRLKPAAQTPNRGLEPPNSNDVKGSQSAGTVSPAGRSLITARPRCVWHTIQFQRGRTRYMHGKLSGREAPWRQAREALE